VTELTARKPRLYFNVFRPGTIQHYVNKHLEGGVATQYTCAMFEFAVFNVGERF